MTRMPGTLRDDFNHALSRDRWKEVYGGEVSNMCGTLVSGLAITFYKVSDKNIYESLYNRHVN